MNQIKGCRVCQKYKITGQKKYAKIAFIPGRENAQPWELVHIDCAGPWTTQFYDKTKK